MDHNPFSEQISALLDGELPPAEMAAITGHLATCPACTRYLADLAALRAALHTELPEADVSEDFHEKILDLIDAHASQAMPVAADTATILAFKKPDKGLNTRNMRRPEAGWAAAAAAVAAMLMVLLFPRHDITRDLMSVRDAALRGNVLHTPGNSLAGPAVAGFQLASARSDIVAGRQAQVFGYRRAGQTVTLCVCPANGEAAHAVRYASYEGMTISYWNDGKQQYWAETAGPAATLSGFLAAMKET